MSIAQKAHDEPIDHAYMGEESKLPFVAIYQEPPDFPPDTPKHYLTVAELTEFRSLSHAEQRARMKEWGLIS